MERFGNYQGMAETAMDAAGIDPSDREYSSPARARQRMGRKLLMYVCICDREVCAASAAFHVQQVPAADPSTFAGILC
jgi:hypothetical protein